MNSGVPLFLICISAISAVIAGEESEFRLVPSKTIYAPRDTVVLALRVEIPDGYCLYGNPKGPGVGRPLYISIESDDEGVQWLAVKKMNAEKYGPSFGEWVWVYRNETTFFCIGLITSPPRRWRTTFNGSIRFDGLFCRDACRSLATSIPFSFVISENTASARYFADNRDLPEKYKHSMPMMDLKQFPLNRTNAEGTVRCLEEK